jgi:hypothetical protein
MYCGEPVPTEETVYCSDECFDADGYLEGASAPPEPAAEGADYGVFDYAWELER